MHDIKQLKQVVVIADGSSRGFGTPKSASAAAAIGYKRTWRMFGMYLGEATSQQAEMAAVAMGLQALTEPCHVTVLSDSEYVIKTMRGQFKRKANLEWWSKIERAAAPHVVTWQWTKGHADHDIQEIVDKVAQDISQRGTIDPVFIENKRRSIKLSSTTLFVNSATLPGSAVVNTRVLGASLSSRMIEEKLNQISDRFGKGSIQKLSAPPPPQTKKPIAYTPNQGVLQPKVKSFKLVASPPPITAKSVKAVKEKAAKPLPSTPDPKPATSPPPVANAKAVRAAEREAAQLKVITAFKHEMAVLKKALDRKCPDWQRAVASEFKKMKNADTEKFSKEIRYCLKLVNELPCLPGKEKEVKFTKRKDS